MLQHLGEGSRRHDGSKGDKTEEAEEWSMEQEIALLSELRGKWTRMRGLRAEFAGRKSRAGEGTRRDLGRGKEKRREEAR